MHRSGVDEGWGGDGVGGVTAYDTEGRPGC